MLTPDRLKNSIAFTTAQSRLLIVENQSLDVLQAGWEAGCKGMEFALNSAEESEHLRRWVLIANVKGRYSRGSSETVLDQDLALLRDGGGVPELLDRLRQQAGRLDITPGELEGRNKWSALFKTMFLAFRAAGAKDWLSQVQIALDHSGTQHKLQFHHVFARALLEGASAPAKRTTSHIRRHVARCNALVHPPHDVNRSRRSHIARSRAG